MKAQRVLLHDARLLSFMCQTFLELPQHGAVEDGASTTVSTTEVARARLREMLIRLVKRYVMRGFLINCGNAIRLQALSQLPSSYVRSFLRKSTEWKNFLPKLLAASADQAKFGMGITVNGMGNMMHNIPALSAMVGENVLNDSNDLSDKDADLGHGSHFARTLDFTTSWPGTMPCMAIVNMIEKVQKATRIDLAITMIDLAIMRTMAHLVQAYLQEKEVTIA